MKLNRIEFLLINNPVRRIIQEYYEIKTLKKMSVAKNIEKALEIGCGSGFGAKLIKKYFSPREIIGIDIDERMIEIAKKRNNDQSITFKLMDASKLEFSDDYFDAVFDFGIIHHIPNWRDCVKEIYRVLKTGGEFICEELTAETFSGGIGRVWRKLLEHPYEEMFTSKEFTDFLKQEGFEILNYKASNPLGLLKHYMLTAVKR